MAARPTFGRLDWLAAAAWRVFQPVSRALQYCRDHLLLADAADYELIRSTFISGPDEGWPPSG